MEKEESSSLEYTTTWVVAAVCFIIVLISLMAERCLHRLGKFLKHKGQDTLFDALQKLKEELMLLGFISLLLTVFQGLISEICIPSHYASSMLPCKKKSEGKSHEGYSPHAINNRRRLFSTDSSSKLCSREGEVPLLSLEALHQLHIFIFVLAVVHVVFCVITMGLGRARIQQWKQWEKWISVHRNEDTDDHRTFFAHGKGYWRKAAVVSWTISFFRQFYGSVTKPDYIALRQGFLIAHNLSRTGFDFHKYIMRTLEVDFKKVVSISWYQWLFVVVFLLLNVEGWHTYFWLSFLPLILLLLVGAKLEHVMIRFALDVDEIKEHGETARVKPSDEHFWFKDPLIVIHLIHFILFQNAFEIAFFFWIWWTYGFHSCIMERMGYIIPRLIMGVIVQVLCSYITMPLHALVTQMGSRPKEGLFHKFVHEALGNWLPRRKGEASKTRQTNEMVKESYQSIQIREQGMTSTAGETTKSIIELSRVLDQTHEPST